MKKKLNCWFLPVAFILMTQNIGAGQKDLRPLFEKYSICIYDQGLRGTCSVFAVAGLLEFEYAHTSGKVIPLSVEYLNWASNQITGEPSDGSYFSDAIVALNKYGICSNELFPYHIDNISGKMEPSDAAVRDAQQRKSVSAKWIKEWDPKTGMTNDQIMNVKYEINNEHPVAIGFRWPKNDVKYRKIVNGLMVIPPEEGVFDGHSVIIVGFYDDPEIPGGGYFIFKNSHGMGYGENGYGKMPYKYVQSYANDGIAIHLDQ